MTESPSDPRSIRDQRKAIAALLEAHVTYRDMAKAIHGTAEDAVLRRTADALKNFRHAKTRNAAIGMMVCRAAPDLWKLANEPAVHTALRAILLDDDRPTWPNLFRKELGASIRQVSKTGSVARGTYIAYRAARAPGLFHKSRVRIGRYDTDEKSIPFTTLWDSSGLRFRGAMFFRHNRYMLLGTAGAVHNPAADGDGMFSMIIQMADRKDRRKFGGRTLFQGLMSVSPATRERNHAFACRVLFLRDVEIGAEETVMEEWTEAQDIEAVSGEIAAALAPVGVRIDRPNVAELLTNSLLPRDANACLPGFRDLI